MGKEEHQNSYNCVAQVQKYKESYRGKEKK